jgi:Nucleotidyl transferase
MRLALGTALAAALLAAPTALGSPLPGAPNCPIFPASSVWNKPVDRLAVRKDSRTLVNSIGATQYVHADFGSGLWDGGPIGIPVTVVGSSQAGTAVEFHYDAESDPGPYPIPPDVAIEGGPDADGDRHSIIVDRDSCTLYELFDLHPAWEAGSRGDLEPIGRLAIRAPRSPDCPVEPIPPLAYVLEMSINPQERGLPAVVLVGGQGTRLGPLTEQTPNPMLPLLGRPLLAGTPSIS